VVLGDGDGNGDGWEGGGLGEGGEVEDEGDGWEGGGLEDEDGDAMSDALVDTGGDWLPGGSAEAVGDGPSDDTPLAGMLAVADGLFGCAAPAEAVADGGSEGPTPGDAGGDGLGEVRGLRIAGEEGAEEKRGPGEEEEEGEEGLPEEPGDARGTGSGEEETLGVSVTLGGKAGEGERREGEGEGEGEASGSTDHAAGEGEAVAPIASVGVRRFVVAEGELFGGLVVAPEAPVAFGRTAATVGATTTSVIRATRASTNSLRQSLLPAISRSRGTRDISASRIPMSKPLPSKAGSRTVAGGKASCHPMDGRAPFGAVMVASVRWSSTLRRGFSDRSRRSMSRWVNSRTLARCRAWVPRNDVAADRLWLLKPGSVTSLSKPSAMGSGRSAP
jgi:hypothetical protein